MGGKRGVCGRGTWRGDLQKGRMDKKTQFAKTNLQLSWSHSSPPLALGFRHPL